MIGGQRAGPAPVMGELHIEGGVPDRCVGGILRSEKNTSYTSWAVTK